ncbi:hypothetical protein HMPREF1549_00450 [Actinomyces johnsonii F0510]|uniref:Uncharacterized protein n=1 Tax=Actinomyces johnsonii F0510 TaxID=1227262 RepID=U1Q1I8_9ACTO|nr:hypothetical protein HMPREF1549_00450 [Actinomyces johnsonii F0510]
MGAWAPFFQVTVGCAPASPPMVGSDSESESIVRVEQSTGVVAAGIGVSEADALEADDEDDPEHPANARQAAMARAVRLRDVRRT